ncbi:MAG: hypothetical protein QXH35_06330 [Nitrososphaerota archaeon]
MIVMHASKKRSVFDGLIFLERILKKCEDKPAIVVAKDPWYVCVLNWFGIEHS